MKKCIICNKLAQNWASIDDLTVCESCMFKLLKHAVSGDSWNWVDGECVVCECEYEGVPITDGIIICKECLFDYLQLYFDTDEEYPSESETDAETGLETEQVSGLT